MKKIESFLIYLILILAIILRFYHLGQFPPSLNWDEVSHGYNAYSILTTGSDEWGVKYPLTNFRAYGDYPLPLNLFITIPFIKYFGLNETSIRIPHAAIGVLLVLVVYFLAKIIFKNKKPALIASFLVAVEPWYFFPSRFVLQSNLSVFFLTLGITAFLYRDKWKYFLPISIISFGFSLFSYHTTRIFTPLLLLTLLIIYKKEMIQFYKESRRLFILTTLLAFFFFLPLPFILLNPEARARSNEVFLVDQGMIGRIIEYRNSSQLPSQVSKLIYNRPVFFTLGFVKNYVDYFSPKYLFLKGGTQYQFSIPNRGLLYLINLPFFYLGVLLVLYKVCKKKSDNIYKLLIAWLILAPIPASITNERFAVLRSSTLLPLPEIFTVFGLSFIYQKVICSNSILKTFKYCFLLFYLFLLGISLARYLNDYLEVYPKVYSQSWQYGYKEVVEFSKENYNKYDKIIITKKYGEPHEFFLFYWPWDPKQYKNDPKLIRFYKSNWYWVDGYNRFYFVNDWDIPKEEWQVFTLESKKESIDCTYLKCLLITTEGNYPKGWRIIKTINFLDGSVAFEILEN